MKLIFIILLQLINTTIMSQTIIQGEYNFHRQEMVAGFNFLADGKFQFYYSYGAMDRTATGTFTVSGDTVKLKSVKEAGKDFTIKSQSKTGTCYSIEVEDADDYLLTNIRCTFFIGSERHDAFANRHGEIKVDYPNCDKIYVYHLLFPDFVTLIKDEQNENNQFTLTLNPSLAQVSFKGIYFKIEDDKTISCIPNYLMMLENIKFKKE